MSLQQAMGTVATLAKSLDKCKPDGKQGGAYKIQGHINNVPINISFVKCDSQSQQGKNSNNKNKGQAQQNNSQKKQKNPANNVKNSNSSSSQKNPNGNQQNSSKPQSKGGISPGHNMPNQKKHQSNMNSQRNCNKPASKPSQNIQKPPVMSSATVVSKPTVVQNCSSVSIKHPCQKPAPSSSNRSQPKQQYSNQGNIPKGPRMSPQAGERDITWMYVGRIKPGTSKFDMEYYLDVKFPNHKFVIEQLPQWKDAKTMSFKMAIDNEILEEFKNPENWPEGVNIKNFVFYKD